MGGWGDRGAAAEGGRAGTVRGTGARAEAARLRRALHPAAACVVPRGPALQPLLSALLVPSRAGGRAPVSAQLLLMTGARPPALGQRMPPNHTHTPYPCTPAPTRQAPLSLTVPTLLITDARSSAFE
jgi:hypothetical protein